VYNDDVIISQINVEGNLFIPSKSKAIIIFVHGSGSNRFSARNEFISRHFIENGFATLLVDLLTEKEKEEDIITKHLRFDIELLTKRLVSITRWVLSNQLTKHLLIGYFSSSTGTAAALNASIIFKEIGALVSRGGRIDLVENSTLHKIVTPSLFIIGGKDDLIIDINKRAYKEISNTESKELSIIPNASHFFEESGKMEAVSNIALNWFKVYLLKNEKIFINKYRLKPRIFYSFDLKTKFQIKFTNRESAGYILANILDKYRNKNNISLIGIPRGGIIIANVVARELSLKSFNIVSSRRLRNPHNSENTIGSVFQDGSVYLHSTSKNFSEEYLQMEIKRQKKELEKQISLFGINNESYDLKYKTAILVDDGCYTGSTIIVACKWIKSHYPSMIIVATPVIPKHTYQLLSKYVDKIEYIRSPKKFKSVEEYYQDFNPVPENELLQILKKR
jgi:predicted phosphoribosyltransferase/dienelactone hydrolase